MIRILMVILALGVFNVCLPRKQRRWPTTPTPYDDLG